MQSLEYFKIGPGTQIAIICTNSWLMKLPYFLSLQLKSLSLSFHLPVDITMPNLSLKALSASLGLTLLSLPVLSQTLHLDPDKKYQVMHSFGASDCWSMQMVGKYYPENKREKIAEWLFSKATDAEGNPKGIGLSMWRFNIGAGSTEQGKESKITNEWRRAESFITKDGYDWNKQQGQRWFLDAAKRYGVNYTLGFLNSAPVSMTKNGLAIASGKLGDWNFDKTKIDDFSRFLADVSEKLRFDYISPFNEPQWDWGPKSSSGFGSQEGTPIQNADLAWAVRKLDGELKKRNIKTKISVAETAQIDYLYGDKTNRSEQGQDRQIEAFFDTKSPDYLGNLSTLEPAISGHSYFTTSPVSQLNGKREQLAQKLKTHQVSYWQSEYCILGDNAGEINGGKMDLGMKTALYVAKVIHADLTVANASAWHWWLSVSANDYKDGLIYVAKDGKLGENEANKFDGEVMDSKLMWALGNYSRFISPGMERIEAKSEDNEVLVSAFRSKTEVVTVVINPSDKEKKMTIPQVFKRQKAAVYVTSASASLKKGVIKGKSFVIPPASVLTLVLN